jgi:NhaP-type Na+/H+ or K+/H+ antiporter
MFKEIWYEVFEWTYQSKITTNWLTVVEVAEELVVQSVGRVMAGSLFSWFIRRLLSLTRRYYQQMQQRKIMFTHV